MNEARSPRRLLLAVCALALQMSATAATDPAIGADQSDPPERVARLSYLKGNVLFRSTEQEASADAAINRPLTTGDQLRLERNARAELQAGSFDMQLDERSEFSFLELTDDVAQIRLANGALYLSVRRIRDTEVVEVDTPHAAIAIKQPGEYAIDLSDDGTYTRVRTYDGECEVTNDRETVAIKSREQGSFGEGERSTGRSAIESVGSRNAFDSWAHNRALRRERSASSRYVDPEMIGYSDLDEYGDWVQEVDYGYVWIPRHIVVGWSPYRYGRWTWISPWGWTWVDEAPWGFAPFHYGRWAHVRDRWCWVPGPLHVRPVYAPALVAWVGAAPPRVSFSIAFGNGIGWFPLAPREVYVPSYRCSRRYIHNVNYANTVIVNNVYINRAYNDRSTYFDHANRRVHDAVTVVNASAFTESRPVREHRIYVDQRDLGNWRTHNAIPDARPPRERGSLDANARHGENRPTIDRTHEREVVMRHRPSSALAQRAVGERAADDAGNRRPDVDRRSLEHNPSSDAVGGRRFDRNFNSGVPTDRSRESSQRAISQPQRDWRAPPQAPVRSGSPQAPVRVLETPRETQAPRDREVRQLERRSHERFGSPGESAGRQSDFSQRQPTFGPRAQERSTYSERSAPRNHEDRGAGSRVQERSYQGPNRSRD